MDKYCDYFALDSLLTDEERIIRDTTHNFVQKEFIPLIRECYREQRFPKEIIPKIAELGLLGMNLKGYGCAGASNVAYGLAMMELERGDSGLRSFVSVQGALVMYPIYAFGSDEQKEKWLPQMAEGKKIGCFGLTEPDFGSNPAGMLTTAKSTSDGYVLNGTKMWITNGNIADVAIVWAKLDGDTPDHIRGFIVETDRPGFEAREIKTKLSLRASVTSELILDEVKIPKENILPGAIGLKAPLKCLTQARYGIAWGAIGAAIDCFLTALEYSKERRQFRKPIAGHQLVQRKLAYMLTEIVKAQLLAYRLGRLKDEGKYRHTHVSLAKMNNVKIALECARLARDILGANGITDEYPVMRHMCNLETVYTYEGTNDIHTLIIGRDITGLDAFTN